MWAACDYMLGVVGGVDVWRCRLSLPFVAVIVLLFPIVVAGCAGSSDTTSTSSEGTSTSSYPAVEVPPPELPPGPHVLASGTAPLLESGSLNPDARKALLLLEFRVALEQYKASDGRYPDSLEVVFPAFAPLDEQGQALPPTAAADFSYRFVDSSHYQLSVTMSDGEAFSVQEVTQ